MKFNYQARTSDGVIQTGTVEAPNKEVAIDTLRRNNLIILEITEEKKDFLTILTGELPFFN